jgi:hypothetical protein
MAAAEAALMAAVEAAKTAAVETSAMGVPCRETERIN